MLTNKGLVEYAKKALNEKWGYVWGTFGQTLTETLFNQKLSQYPEQVGSFNNFIRANWLNKTVCDCVGLIKSYMWYNNGKVTYNPKTDINANMMYANAKEKGTINTIPEIIGLCVYKQGHIGVYIGNGQVIEARGTKYGVIQTPLRGAGSTPWTHWLKCPYITYVEEIQTIEDACYFLKGKAFSDAEGWIKKANADSKLAEVFIVMAKNWDTLKKTQYMETILQNVIKNIKVG